MYKLYVHRAGVAPAYLGGYAREYDARIVARALADQAGGGKRTYALVDERGEVILRWPAYA